MSGHGRIYAMAHCIVVHKNFAKIIFDKTPGISRVFLLFEQKVAE